MVLKYWFNEQPCVDFRYKLCKLFFCIQDYLFFGKGWLVNLDQQLYEVNSLIPNYFKILNIRKNKKIYKKNNAEEIFFIF